MVLVPVPVLFILVVIAFIAISYGLAQLNLSYERKKENTITRPKKRLGIIETECKFINGHTLVYEIEVEIKEELVNYYRVKVIKVVGDEYHKKDIAKDINNQLVKKEFVELVK